MRTIKGREESYVFPIYIILLSQIIALPGILFKDGEILTSIGTWGMVFVTILELINIFQTAYERKMQYFEYISLIIMTSAFSFFRLGSLTYECLVKLLAFWELPILLFAINRINAKNINKAIYYFFFATTIFYAYLAHSDLAHVMQLSNKVAINMRELVMGFDNPNVTGVYLFISQIGIMSWFLQLENKFIKAGLLADIIYIINLIRQTNSRAAIIMSLLSVIIFVFIKRIKTKWLVSKIFFVIPIIFVPVMLAFGTKLGAINILGESLDTGRIGLYTNFASRMTPLELFFGNFRYIFGNLHNAPLSIFATAGIVCAISFYIMVYSVIKRIAIRNNLEPSQKMALAGISLLVLHSSVEAAVFTAGSSMAAFVILIYILIINKGERKE